LLLSLLNNPLRLFVGELGIAGPLIEVEKVLVCDETERALGDLIGEAGGGGVSASCWWRNDTVLVFLPNFDERRLATSKNSRRFSGGVLGGGVPAPDGGCEPSGAAFIRAPR
jgi:hypothetical protein